MGELLSYPPVFRGLVLLCISGFTFPLAGVCILRMNLLPLRYLLMHGVLLGGAIGLASGLPVPLAALGVNLVLVVLLNRSADRLGTGYGHLSLFFMVASVGAASLVTTLFHVPAKDTLSILWGSLYASSPLSVGTGLLTGAGLVLFSVLAFRPLTAVFHDRDVASSLGIPVALFELAVMLVVGFAVASAMQLMGALLLDAQLILPVVIAGLVTRGLGRTMAVSCLLGGAFSLGGFFLSLATDIPVSAAVALPAAGTFLVIVFGKRSLFREKNV